MKQFKVIKIVVASPSDVQTERNHVAKIAQEFNKGIAEYLGIQFNVARWEMDTYPRFHLEGPQGMIDAKLRIEDCDILICIFWKRFGTPVQDADSGTEHEFQIAYKAWKKKGSPQIMTYINESPYTLLLPEEAEQLKSVLQFRQDFPKEGLLWPYNGEREFEGLVRNHLMLYLTEEVISTVPVETTFFPKQEPEEKLEHTPDDLTLLDIVRKYRLVYRNAYMMQTLGVTEPRSEPMRLQAFLDDGIGFPGHYIIVSFDGPGHDDIWATDLLIRRDDDTLVGVILINPDLLQQSAIVRKAILAEEWIKIMRGFENQGRPEKRVAGRAAMIARLYNLSVGVKRSVPWEDTPDEKSNLHIALRELLVPIQAIDEMAHEFGFPSLSAVGDLFISDPIRAQTTIEELAKESSEKWSVEVDLVIDRIREILLNAP